MGHEKLTPFSFGVICFATKTNRNRATLEDYSGQSTPQGNITNYDREIMKTNLPDENSIKITIIKTNDGDNDSDNLSVLYFL